MAAPNIRATCEKRTLVLIQGTGDPPCFLR